MSRRGLAAGVTVAMLLTLAPGAQAALVRIGLNGARPSQLPILAEMLANAGFTQAQWLPFASRVGENWLPGLHSIGVDYPAQLGPLWGAGSLTGDQSTAVGQRNLDAAIRAQLAQGNTVAVTGLSEGSLVVDAEIAYLATDPKAPPADSTTFYVFGDQNRGFGVTYPVRGSVPILGFTLRRVPESQYDVVVVEEVWDGWANPPDRPWNLIADLNAVMGAVFTINGVNDHSRTSLDSMSDAVEVSKTTSSLGGTTTTYMIYRDELPLTRPLLQFGVPAHIVSTIDKMLMPVIRAGYSSMTPNLGPRIENGRLVFTRRPTTTEPGSAVSDKALSAADTPTVDPSDVGTARRTLTPRYSDTPGASQRSDPWRARGHGSATKSAGGAAPSHGRPNPHSTHNEPKRRDSVAHHPNRTTVD